MAAWDRCRVFEVPAAARGWVHLAPLQGMGGFHHEVAADDPRTGTAHLTEDRDDNMPYRSLPDRSG